MSSVLTTRPETSSNAIEHSDEKVNAPMKRGVDVYFSADVETDGPIPGPFSVLSFALVVAGRFDCKRFTAPQNLLSADGSINRMGSGTLEDTDRELFIGRIDPAIFEAVRSHLTAAMLQRLGQAFQNQNTRGVACKLKLNFQFRDGTSNGLGFLYGSESEGMPEDVADLVTAAVHETDPWYENFKRTAAGRRKP